MFVAIELNTKSNKSGVEFEYFGDCLNPPIPKPETTKIKLGEGIVDNYERTRVGLLHNQQRYSTDTTWMGHAGDRNLLGWRKATNPALRLYGNMMESIHNGARGSARGRPDLPE